MKIEFFTYDDIPEILIRENNEITFLEKRIDVQDVVLGIIKNDYPEAYNALFDNYNRAWNFKFLAVRRFIKCNLSCNDSNWDLEENTLSFEKVHCPLKGECKWDGIICNPKFNLNLSAAELRVYELLAENLEEVEIADSLFISINTLRIHRKSIYKKLGFTSKGDLIIHFKKNNHNV